MLEKLKRLNPKWSQGFILVERTVRMRRPRIISLSQWNRKATADPNNDVVEVGSSEIQPSSSKHVTSIWACSASGFQITQGNIFIEGLFSEGAQILRSLLTLAEEARLRDM